MMREPRSISLMRAPWSRPRSSAEPAAVPGVIALAGKQRSELAAKRTKNTGLGITKQRGELALVIKYPQRVGV